MAIKIQSTAKKSFWPRTLLYSFPGGAKTSLAATLATPGKRDIIFGCSEGGVEAISHLDLPYTDIKTPTDYSDFINYLKNGKVIGDGVIQCGNQEYKGVCMDMFSHIVHMNLIEMTAESKARNAERDIDDPSEYEYKKLNQRILRLMDELRKLPLKYIVLTAWVEEKRKKDGTIEAVRPKFVGSNIWQSVAGLCGFCFYLQTPEFPKQALEKRILYTQPHPIFYAKARVPGVAGALPIPAKIDYTLGHTTLLPKIFGRVEEYITGQRKLQATSPIPDDLSATVEESDPQAGKATEDPKQ